MSDQSIKTVGNYMSYGPDGERVAAFATEQDRTVFEALVDLIAGHNLSQDEPDEYPDEETELQAGAVEWAE
jgi:hypothetical protein